MIVQMLANRPGVLPGPTIPETRAQFDGIAHEDKMHARFEREFGPLYLPAPWLRYRDTYGSWRYCQPDGLLFVPSRGVVVICEAKLLHTPAAIPQTKRYHRVVSILLPAWKPAILEVVRYYKGEGVDKFNIPVRMVLRPESAFTDIFNVMILGRF